MNTRPAESIKSAQQSLQRALAKVSLALAWVFVPIYALLWLAYPRLYFSQYIQIPWSFLGYTLYLILMAEIAIYAIVKFLQRRFILFLASAFSTTLVLRVMLHDPSSVTHFEYFVCAFGLAIYIFVIDIYGRQIIEFLDSKEKAFVVLGAIPGLPLLIIGFSASSAAIEKAVIMAFLVLAVARNIGWKRGDGLAMWSPRIG